MDQLKWEAILNTSQIGVAVTNGIVTISDTVDSYVKKIAAENATKKVAGVKTLVQE